MDEIDAIGSKRMGDGSSAGDRNNSVLTILGCVRIHVFPPFCVDREVQRTLMELLSQLDGFEDLGQVKIVMATNRPDVLDPALLR
jgi:26S proteasome regulatory subunit T4